MKRIISMFTVRSEYDIKLLLLYTLNVTDYIFTLVLISSGLFIEANPILNTHIEGLWGFILKCMLPLLLVLYLHIRFLTGIPKHKKIVKLLINGIIIYYIIINVMHIFWLTLTFCIFG